MTAHELPTGANLSDAGADTLDDAEVQARRLASQFDMAASDPDVHGALCSNGCGRTTKPAHLALCAHHEPVCDDCYPNGCARCTAKVERDTRRREEALSRAITAMGELRASADDLAAVRLAEADWRALKDLRREVELAADALGHITTLLDAIPTRGTRL